MTDKNTSTLLLIDCQEGFSDWDYWGGNRNNPDLESNLRELLERYRERNQPIFHIIHHSNDPDSILRTDKPSGKIMNDLSPRQNEPVFIKRENSAFVGTNLDVYLRRQNINDLTIAGLTTNHCVSTSTRMAGNLGYDVKLVGDACATFDRIGPTGLKFESQLIHDMSLSDLHNEFCQVTSTAEVAS